MIKRTSSVIGLMLVVLLVAAGVAAQNKSWKEWSKKDVEKLLNNSPWGQTQTDTDTSEMTFSPTRPAPSGSSTRETNIATSSTIGRDAAGVTDNRGERGATNQAAGVTYRVRLFSAKPIRQALVRFIILAQPNPSDQLLARLQPFIDVDYGGFIVVAVAVESSDRRFSGPVEQVFASAAADILKNKCYLQRKDGARVFLTDYERPTADGSGAKFIFPRDVDGKPFFSGPADTLRFVAELSDTVKVNRIFKLADTMYEGKLEF